MDRSEPHRTCVGCRQRALKRDLLRIVRTAEGAKPAGKGGAPGRGAYMHRSEECIEQALRRGGLARALRTSFSQEEAGRLRELIGRGSRDA